MRVLQPFDQLADKHLSLVWRERDIVWIEYLAFEYKAMIRPINEGGYSLKKRWCCIGGRVQQGHSVLSTELIT